MRERMEMKTKTGAVMVSAGWPMVLGWLAMSAFMLLTAGAIAWPLIGVMAAIMAVVFTLCIRMYLGTYLFLPATEYKGARIIARLGRNEVEIGNVLRSEVIVKQGWIEKMMGVCHIREKGTSVYLRGVPEMEKVQRWVEANFPKSRPEVARKSKSANKRE